MKLLAKSKPLTKGDVQLLTSLLPKSPISSSKLTKSSVCFCAGAMYLRFNGVECFFGVLNEVSVWKVVSLACGHGRVTEMSWSSPGSENAVPSVP